MNKIIVTGRIANTPNGGTTNSNVNYSRFTIASQRRSYGNNQDPIVDFLPCVAWRSNAEFVNKFLDKGALVLIEGSLQASRVNRNGVQSVLYSINVDTIEGLETKKSVELRKQTQDTQTFEVPEFSNSDNNSSNLQKNNSSHQNDDSSWSDLFDEDIDK